MLTTSSYLLQLHLLCGLLLQICNYYAGEYGNNFSNPDKSKFLVIPANKRRHLYSAVLFIYLFIYFHLYI